MAGIVASYLSKWFSLPHSRHFHLEPPSYFTVPFGASPPGDVYTPAPLNLPSSSIAPCPHVYPRPLACQWSPQACQWRPRACQWRPQACQSGATGCLVLHGCGQDTMCPLPPCVSNAMRNVTRVLHDELCVRVSRRRDGHPLYMLR